MKSYDYDAVVHDCSCYCVQCIPDGVSEDECSPIFAGSEWDGYPSCDHCGAELDYVGLTREGVLIQAKRNGAEIFHEDFANVHPDTWQADLVRGNEGSTEGLSGWYWWTCEPGCLPDSEPSGPFKTEYEAAGDAL